MTTSKLVKPHTPPAPPDVGGVGGATPCPQEKLFQQTLIIKYDPTGDILYINKCAPYPEQESEELGDDIIVRVNPQTEEIENLEILFFSQRLQEKNELQLPLIANLRLAG